MALRHVLTDEDPTLHKKCRIVSDFNPRLHELLDDMADTLAHADGVGIAAPQVGILRRVVLVLETNVPDGEEPYIIELINPEIIRTEGEQHEPEGCLSVPGEFGIVKRPALVEIKAQNRYGEPFSVVGEGLTAACLCHELDHLEGIVFKSKCERMLTQEELDEMREKESN